MPQLCGWLETKPVTRDFWGTLTIQTLKYSLWTFSPCVSFFVVNCCHYGDRKTPLRLHWYYLESWKSSLDFSMASVRFTLVYSGASREFKRPDTAFNVVRVFSRWSQSHSMSLRHSGYYYQWLTHKEYGQTWAADSRAQCILLPHIATICSCPQWVFCSKLCLLSAAMSVIFLASA